VTVRLAPDESPFVQVMGAVHRPGRHRLEGRRRLFDVLLAAGGFTTQASGAVHIQRAQGTFADGTSERRFRLPAGSPTPDALGELAATLNAGDVVTAALEKYVTVKGQVVRPGRYPLQGETTVRSAVSAAGGLTRSGSHRARVDRRDPTTGRVESLHADLEAIEQGREQDLPLFPEDHVEVEPRRL
jgi:polysaccharide export outer membrane protein